MINEGETMSNFSDFLKDESKKNITSNDSDNKDNDNKKLEDIIHKYEAYSQNDLMKEFLKLTHEKKQKGELSEGELEKLKMTILPFLNDEQKVNLNKIIDMVGNVK